MRLCPCQPRCECHTSHVPCKPCRVLRADEHLFPSLFMKIVIAEYPWAAHKIPVPHDFSSGYSNRDGYFFQLRGRAGMSNGFCHVFDYAIAECVFHYFGVHAARPSIKTVLGNIRDIIDKRYEATL